MTNQENASPDIRMAARLACAAIACLAALFLAVLLLGTSIPTLGNTPSSLIYSLLVCLPLAGVVALTLARSR